MEYVNPLLEVPYLFQQKLLLQNPTRYKEGDIPKNAPSVQVPHLMLVNKEECWTQVQPRSDQDRLAAVSTDPSYLTWQGVPNSLGQM